MARLKGIKVTRKVEDEYEVVPLYHASRGGARVGTSLRAVGKGLAPILGTVIASLLARKELEE